jgi:micrococcal nuclease
MKTWQKIVLGLGGLSVFCLVCLAGLLVVSAVIPIVTSSEEVNKAPFIISEEFLKYYPTETLALIIPTDRSTQFPLPTFTFIPSLTPIPTGLGSSPVACVPAQTPQRGMVAKVIDGDTIEVVILEKTYKVRYIGMDTPEIQDSDPLAVEASRLNNTLVYGKTILLYRDVSETDQYGRLLRYVFVGDLFVNYDLVRQGVAEAKDYPPDSACKLNFEVAEQEAQLASLGLWSAILNPTQPAPAQPIPTQPVRSQPLPPVVANSCPQGCTTPPQGCTIKGNISSSREKIYHMPGQQDYNKTIIDPTKGERWFCTEQEAINNGWRKAKR